MTLDPLADGVLAELGGRVEALRAARATDAADELGRCAHTLKGSALVLGLDDLAVTMTALEASLAAGDDSGVERAIGAADRVVVGLATERLLGRARHDLRNELGKVMMGAGLLELELAGEHAERVRLVVEAAAAAATRVDALSLGTTASLVPAPRPPVGAAGIVPAGLRVLIVDDDLAAAASLGELLAGAGAAPVLAGDLEAARSELERGGFGAALVDLRVDGAAGEKLLPSLRLHAVRAIAFTGDPEAAGAGWDGVVAKGSPSEAILAALEPAADVPTHLGD